MSEGKIYYFLKNYLINKRWRILAGEPPDGSDNVPRIEIRSKNRSGIGSGGSYKIDLIALKQNTLLLIELKPRYNQGDIDKLNIVTSERLGDLFDALKERHGLNRNEIKQVIKCIGVSYLGNNILPSDFLAFLVKEESEIEVKYGNNLNPQMLLEN